MTNPRASYRLDDFFFLGASESESPLPPLSAFFLSALGMLARDSRDEKMRTLQSFLLKLFPVISRLITTRHGIVIVITCITSVKGASAVFV
jgi:hypothetical protein